MIDREHAIALAKKRAADNNWGFSEPLNIVERRGWFSKAVTRYEIETNAEKKGTKARFIIDAKTGEILSEGYVPR